MKHFSLVFCFLLSAFAFQPDHAQGKVCGYRNPQGRGYVGTGCAIDSSGVATCDADCTEIENYAFQGETIISVDLSNTSITFIDKFAFNGCNQVQTVTLPPTLTSLGIAVFSSCTSLQSVTFPTSLTSIGQGAFLSCSALQSVDLSNTSVSSIGQGAFMGMADPSEITVIRGSYAHKTLGEKGTSTESGGAINSTYADAQTKLKLVDGPTPPKGRSGLNEEIRVVPLPEDEFGSYELDPVNGEKVYLIFHTYDICMDFLNNEELCSGYERCYHK